MEKESRKEASRLGFVGILKRSSNRSRLVSLFFIAIAVFINIPATSAAPIYLIGPVTWNELLGLVFVYYAFVRLWLSVGNQIYLKKVTQKS